MELHFEPIAFLLFSVLKFFLGFIWYSPFLFGDSWMEEAKISHEFIEEKKNNGKLANLYISQFLLQTLTLFIHYQLLLWYNQNLVDSLYFTLLLFFGFVAPTFLGNMLWENNSIKLFFINSGYHLVSMIFFSVFIFTFEEEKRKLKG